MKKFKFVKFCLGVLGIALISFIGILGYPKLRNKFTTNYWTTDYFSLTDYKQIKPGMTCDEVRNSIGIPLVRIRYKRAGWYWVYSQPLFPDKPYRKFVVVFDNDTDTVLRCFKMVDRAFKDSKTGRWVNLVHPPALPCEITHFDYPMIQGEPPIVKARAGKIYLIQLMATWCGPCTKDRVKIEKLLKEDLYSIPVQLLLVSVDKSKETLREYLRKNQVNAPVAWDPNDHLSEHINLKSIPRHFILKDNILYPFDFPHYTGESEQYYDDLTWFIRYHGSSVSRKDKKT